MRLFPLILICGVLVSFEARAHHPVRGDPVAGRAVASACIGCHGGDEMAPVAGFPTLHGQKENYLIKQLIEMRRAARVRAGEAKPRETDVTNLIHSARSNEVMDRFVLDLTDDQIKNVSAYYSQLACIEKTGKVPIPPPFEVRCQVCHGENGVATSPHLPNIAGQDYDYLLRQLRHFKAASEGSEDEKRRRAVMESQMRILSEQDIRDVAHYYAALTCSH